MNNWLDDQAVESEEEDKPMFKRSRIVEDDDDDDEEEEEEEDDEKMNEEMKGFIVNEDEDEDEEEEEDEKNAEDEEVNDELEEEDQELIEENLGYQIKKKARRVRVYTDSEGSDNDEGSMNKALLKRSLFPVDEISGVDGKGVRDQQSSYHSTKSAYDEYEGSESAEGSGLDDFIQDDEDEVRVAPKKKAHKNRLPVSDRALEEARNLFGVGFNVEDFYAEEEDLEGEEDVEDEEEYEEGEDEESRRLRLVPARRKTAKKTLLEEIEPSDLERGFLSDFDKRVQLEDKPERFQLRSVPVTAAGTEELMTEARWIYQKAFSGGTITRQGDCSRSLPVSAVEKIRDVLNLIRNQEFEVPFIAFYRKEYVQPELNINDLWSIYSWDEKWCQLQKRKQNLRLLFKSMQDYLNSLQPVDGSVSDQEHPLTDDDILAITRAQSFEELQDMYVFFLLYYSHEVPKMLEEKRRKSVLTDAEDSADPEALRPSTSRRNRYQICVQAGLAPLVKEIGLTPSELAENLQASYAHHELRRSSHSFSQLCEKYICKQFPDVRSVTNAVKHMVALQLSREPLVRRIVREEYIRRATICVRPTAMGRKEIDESHVVYPYKYVNDKPVSELKRDEYLLYMQARDNRLLDVKIRLRTIGGLTYYEELLERRIFQREERDELTAEWNSLRDEILRICLEEMLYPGLEKELSSRLLEEAQHYVLRKAAARMQDWLKVGPYSLHLPDESASDDSQSRQLILGLSYPQEDDQATFCALVDKHGEVVSHLRLPYLTQRPIGRARTENVENDWAKLKKFIERKPPIAIAIAASSLRALNIKRDVEAALAGMLAEGTLTQEVPVELVDDEVAKVYAKSEVAKADFGDYPVLLKQAISIARRLNDPLIEFAQLCNQDEEILFLKFHPLQEYVSKDDLLKVVTLEFINRTNEVGVDMNRCLEHPYTACLLQFVCGLGPRKASYLLKLLRQKEGQIESRTQLVTECHMAPKVFINCSGFIKIDPRFSSYRAAEHDVLDCSRVHPSTYEWARKMAEDALEYEGDEAGSNRSPLDEILEAPERLKSLDLDAFAEELMRQGFGNMQITLYDIRAELIHRYKDLREPFRSPEDRALLYMLIKESSQTFDVGKLTLGRVMHTVYRRPPKERDGKIVPTRDPATNMWQCPFCLRDDFPELSDVWTHHDMELCPGQAIGVKVRLENGLVGFIRMKYLSDSGVVNASEQVRPGTTLIGRILKVDTNRMSVELTCRTSDLEDRESRFRPERDPYYDFEAEEEDRRNDRAAVAARFKNSYVKRVIVHPCFHNCTCKEAEEMLGPLEPGEVVIRPSSKGDQYLTLTWKVANGIYQHISIREENKEHPFNLGKSLIIDDETYEDLDEVLCRRIHPMAMNVREVFKHKYYRDSNGGDRSFLQKALMEEKKMNTNRIPYSFSASREFPGKFLLSYMPGSRVRHEYITILPEGFRFRGRIHSNLNALLKWFKEHYRDPVPSQYATAASDHVAASATTPAAYDAVNAYLTPGSVNVQSPWGMSPMNGRPVQLISPIVMPTQRAQYTFPMMNTWNAAFMAPPPPPPAQLPATASPYASRTGGQAAAAQYGQGT